MTARFDHVSLCPAFMQKLDRQISRAPDVRGVSGIHADGGELHHLAQHLLISWPDSVDVGDQLFVSMSHGLLPTLLGLARIDGQSSVGARKQ